MTYKIYAKMKKGNDRFGQWDGKSYTTRKMALKKVDILEKKFGKKREYTPAWKFDVRKV